ncbi:ATP-binding protein [Dyella sp. Sa]|uniref:histidine kinase n=2 Tax=Dyella lutea TaxID=2950441 RepID=A0ABT1F9A0_9GAMM|nr:ATP-binding protein [Dyella lutea]MCP1373950.1 ATP-binding protein [Dyella lutea]
MQMRNLSFLRWRVVGLLLSVVVIVALPYAITRNTSNDALDASQWVTHSSEVKSITYRIAYLSRDAEAASYRIVLSGDDEAAQARIDDASHAISKLIWQLRDLTRDNPDQQALIGSLQTTISGRSTLMWQALWRARHNDRPGAEKALRDAGKLFVLGDVLDKIVSTEDRLLVDRRKAAEAQSSNYRLVLGIGAFAQMLLLGIIVVVSERQIGERLRAEERESQAVRRSRQIVQAVREPIVLLDKELNTLLVNAAFAELYGMDPDEKQSLPLAELGGGAWDDGPLLQRLGDVMLRDRELWDYELNQRTADGADRRVVINARRVQQESDEPALLVTVSDITVRALVERQVKELNRQLEGKVEQISDVNRELEAFSYSVSHDLRAPLRHIAGFAGKLERHLGERLDDKGHHYLGVISGSAQRMAQLIDDLLVFSRLGRGALRLQPVDMQSLVDEARTLAEPDTTDRRVEWKVAPLPVVVGDENMLRMVWQNLVSNAVKYTGKCDVARISIETTRAANGDYQFTVADNGAGFDMEYAGKLFGVFQRLHRASDFPGNGIGLANVRRIVARHGGRVWAEGEPGKGARFHFSLPASEAGDTHRQDRS